MERTYIKDLKDYVGKEVIVKGWVDVRRDQGKMVFLDLRDMSGKVQAVVLPNHVEALEVAQRVRPEWVVCVSAQINKRPERNIKEGVLNGDIELEVLSVEVLNEAQTPPMDVTSDGHEIGEETRLKYRYLDLRRPRLQHNMRLRHDATLYARNFLSKNGFIEIETPLLTKSTPEGSRDYVVPSRIEQGKFYALPQSPQQYKQLLMVAGMEKYFQIARCMRDEDTRGDRQPEFTQLDMEISFATKEEIMELNEKLLIELVQTLTPEKRIQTIPFPRITYKEAMEKYGNDKPDMREDKNDPNLLAFCWVIDFPFFEKDKNGGWTFTHNPFSAPMPEHMAWLMNKEKIGEILATQYDVALNGFEIGGGSIRNHQPEALIKVLEIMGHTEEGIRENFGHMLDAFSYGAPPHGGIAWGLDRFLSVLTNEPNIREVIAFPKTGEGRDLMMEAPSEISAEQLQELGIATNRKM
ncbi:MAG TPA: aspartate--tRNA ligase [Candidatus Yonathbacteria bacterium]|nr:MAG: Aspartyl-tRNA synthetase [Candidatus Nomurabacteria bacterium GW2011_GWA2_42_41]TAN35491.1 MAG: aspartate--tRNA ligase [Patescibacteria group bacterium]HBH71283.1 aspartate--tRNA ligase [Candidatus Yonathbacteria bacterium]